MNERIIKFAVEAGIEFTFDPTEKPMRVFVECWENELEKFAELIVRECMDVANTYQNRGGNCYVDDMIAKHFGVEQ